MATPDPVSKTGSSTIDCETRYVGMKGLDNPASVRQLDVTEDSKMRKEAITDQADENKKNVKCGIYYCFSKFIEHLPTIGEADMKESSSEFEELLRFGAWQVIQLIVPVFVCIVVVVVFQLTIEVYSIEPQQKLLILPFSETSSSSGTNFLFGLVNAAVFLALLVIVTIILVLLLKFKCDKTLFAWLFVTSGILLFMVSSIYFLRIVIVRSLVIDWFMFVFITWNFGSLGLIVIQWKGPLKLQQAYLILTSALMAIVMIAYLPEWTAWILLASISVYDLFSVLCPKGPLNILVKIAKERGEIKLPSLLYSSTMVWVVGMADMNKKSTTSGTDPKGSTLEISSSTSKQSKDAGGEDSDEHTKKIEGQFNSENEEQDGTKEEERHTSGRGPEEEVEEKRGFKLGLGDFIFYSVLVGKAASISEGNWIIIISCSVAILMGLCLTSLILGIVRKALPALPISIFFGLVFYFASQYILAPYVEMLNVNQVFI